RSAQSPTTSRSTRMRAGSVRCRVMPWRTPCLWLPRIASGSSRTTAPRRAITATPSSPITPESWRQASATRRRACSSKASISPRSSATAPNGASSATAAPTSTPKASCDRWGRRDLADLAHMPAMAHADRLAGERIGLEGGEEQGHVGHVLDRGELLVHGLGEHDLLDHALLADAELLGLLGDLLLDERRLDEAWADDIGAHAMRRTFLGHHPGEAEQAVLGRHIGGFQRLGFVGMH